MTWVHSSAIPDWSIRKTWSLLLKLQQRVDSGDFAVAFACYPVSIEQLFTIADSGEVMPPKSTWFEPKLRDGLVVYMI